MEAKAIQKLNSKDKAAICARFTFIPLGIGITVNAILCVALAIITALITVIINFLGIYFGTLGGYIWGGVFGFVAGIIGSIVSVAVVSGNKKIISQSGYENFLEKGTLGLSKGERTAFMRAAEKNKPFRPKRQIYPYLLFFLLEAAIGSVVVFFMIKLFPVLQEVIKGDMSQLHGPGSHKQPIGYVVAATCLGATAAFWIMDWFVSSICALVVFFGDACKKCGYITFEVLIERSHYRSETKEEEKEKTGTSSGTIGTLYIDGKKAGTVRGDTGSWSMKYKRTVTTSECDEERLCPCCGHRYTKHIRNYKYGEWRRVY